MANGLFTSDPYAGMSHAPQVDWEAKRDEGLARMGRAGKGLLLGATPLGDIDFANELRKKVARGEEISTFDKIMAASMAAPFIPAALRKGGRETADLIRAMRGKGVKFTDPVGEFNTGARLDLSPDAVDPEDLKSTLEFQKLASDLFDAEDVARKQMGRVPPLLDVARKHPTFKPALEGLNEAEATNVLARARDAHKAGKLGGIDYRVEDGRFVVETTDTLAPQLRGKGHGAKMYMALVGRAAQDPKIRWVESDAIVSGDAARVYNSLAKRGIQVERNPLAYWTGSHWVTEGRSGPVFRIKTDSPKMFGEPIEDLLTRPSALDEALE